MRTTKNVQKTESKAIKKTISKTFAIVISLVLISFTVSAQGFWKHLLVNNTYGKMAELMVEQKNADEKLLKINDHLSKTTIIVPIAENTFESYFGSKSIYDLKTTHAASPMLGWTLEGSALSN